MSADRLNILLVEDNPGDARLVKEALAETGAGSFNLTTETTFAAGLAHLQDKPVDLVLLDLTLPDSSGFDTFKAMHTRVSSVPVIVLTGFDDDAQAARAVQAGAQDYLVKGQVNGTLLARSIRYAIERNRIEELLREDERRYRSIFEGVEDAILIESQDGRILDVNRCACEMFGYSREQFLTMTAADLLPAEEKIAAPNPTDPAAFPFHPIETINVRANGERFPIELNTRVQSMNGENILFVVGRDITERKQSEGILARQDRELARLYRASGSLLTDSPLDPQALARQILKTVMVEFGQSSGSIFLVEQESRKLTRIASEGPSAGRTNLMELTLNSPGQVSLSIRSSQTINTADVRSDPLGFSGWEAARSELTIPLKIGERVIGAIDIQSAQPAGFSTDDERLITIFSERAALALEHARLYSQTERRLENLTALRSIDIAIASSFDVNLTLGVLLEQATRQLGIQAARVLIFDPDTLTLSLSSGRRIHQTWLEHTRFRLEDSCAGQAVRERKTITLNDLTVKVAALPEAADLVKQGFTAYMGVPLIAKGLVKGVLEIYQRGPIDLDQEQCNFLELLAGQAAIAIDSAQLFENLQGSNAELMLAYDETIEGWAQAMELRDKETQGHSRRVTALTVKLAASLGVQPEQLIHIRRGALLHDIGKLGVPDEILLKHGGLSDEERLIMHKHPQFAYDLLEPITYLHPALDIPYCHHERWDGSGYPRGLREDQIPLAARIFAVVDVWDALTSDRPYREAWSKERTLAHIQAQSGKHFDPRVVNTFLREQGS